PEKATRDMYLDAEGNPTKDSIFGWRSSGTPGSVAGFDFAHKKFGSKPWAELVAPALQLARNGFSVSQTLADSFHSSEKRLRAGPESKLIFLRDGTPYKAGETFKQPELADTLARIAKGGAKEFYEGETAKRLAAAMAAHGGLITAHDLEAYKVMERTPLEGDYKQFHIITAPPPSAGGVGVLQ